MASASATSGGRGARQQAAPAPLARAAANRLADRCFWQAPRATRFSFFVRRALDISLTSRKRLFLIGNAGPLSAALADFQSARLHFPDVRNSSAGSLPLPGRSRPVPYSTGPNNGPLHFFRQGQNAATLGRIRRPINRRSRLTSPIANCQDLRHGLRAPSANSAGARDRVLAPVPIALFIERRPATRPTGSGRGRRVTRCVLALRRPRPTL